MKILILNGSPHKNGTTYSAIHEMEKIFSESLLFLVKSIALGKEKFSLPEQEAKIATNFCRKI